jgi:hypothetical protein
MNETIVLTVLLEQLKELDVTVNSTDCISTLRAVETRLKSVREVMSVADALLGKVTSKMEGNVAPALVARNPHLDPSIQNALAPFLSGPALPMAA